jgi:Asp-tRNA(Asn)/Glu-tRNA(Gln) amidotransferase C subunit
MTTRITPADVTLLAELAGLRLPTEDLAPLADALAAHLAFVAPLLDADLEDVHPSLTHDPRWRD